MTRTHYLLYKRPRWYHSATKTRATERILKLIRIHTSVIYQILWIYWISLSFRETQVFLVHLITELWKKSGRVHVNRWGTFLLNWCLVAVEPCSNASFFVCEDRCKEKDLMITRLSIDWQSCVQCGRVQNYIILTGSWRLADAWSNKLQIKCVHHWI